MPTSRILVVSATGAEAAHVPTTLELLVTGLGKTAAAVATARALSGMDRRSLVVVNIGTAGALRDEMSGIHLPGTVLNHDMNGDAIRALGYEPHDTLLIPDGDDTVLASGDVFVTDSLERRGLADRAHLVDMEGYAVAFAARSFDVPVRLVKHVSDNADEAAMDWPGLVDASARALAIGLLRMFDPRQPMLSDTVAAGLPDRAARTALAMVRVGREGWSDRARSNDRQDVDGAEAPDVVA